MDKRYQVFISSTFTDLHEPRQEVMQALLELDCIPAGMELFPAANDDQWTLIKRVIDDCDYYIVIIGGRYGSIGPNGKSFTQMEYEYALEQGKPVIAFLYKEPGKLPAEDSETDPKKVKKLEEFRKITQEKLVRFWTSAADLGSVVSRSLIKLIKTNPAVGWVKANNLPPKEATEEILELRKTIDSLAREIEEIRTSAPKDTEHLAQADEKFEIQYNFIVYTHSALNKNYDGSFSMSWWDIFAAISPLMIDEATDTDLIRELNRQIMVINIDELMKNDDLNGHTIRNFSINKDDFNTIKVQLLALRLIMKSVKNRSVKDKQNYWALAPYGETIMTQLRAIKKDGYVEPTPKPPNKVIKLTGK